MCWFRRTYITHRTHVLRAMAMEGLGAAHPSSTKENKEGEEGGGAAWIARGRGGHRQQFGKI